MLRLAPLLILVAFAAACGGGALSVEEYQQWCRESATEYEPFADLKAQVEGFDPGTTVNVFDLVAALDVFAERFGAASDSLSAELGAALEASGCFGVAEPEALQHQ